MCLRLDALEQHKRMLQGDLVMKKYWQFLILPQAIVVGIWSLIKRLVSRPIPPSGP